MIVHAIIMFKDKLLALASHESGFKLLKSFSYEIRSLVEKMCVLGMDGGRSLMVASLFDLNVLKRKPVWDCEREENTKKIYGFW